jgi:hypothetical protein
MDSARHLLIQVLWAADDHGRLVSDVGMIEAWSPFTAATGNGIEQGRHGRCAF